MLAYHATGAQAEGAAMKYTRQNVWNLGNKWADPILWYARGVKAMQDRPLAEPTSWRFYAAIHGFNPGLWRQLGYYQPTDQAPSASVVRQFWNQCQHGTWYFLPWHRGYLLAFEATVRAAVVQAGGPADWALPYWNYFPPHQAALPAEFASPNWPDGADDNPLFVVPRYGPSGDGNVFVPRGYVDLRAVNDPRFTGGTHGGSTGFGGPDTGFMHASRTSGRLELQPHNVVHGLVGGARDNDQNQPGAMSIPESAALDPIFWLHHANIDRLWQAWSKATAGHLDPTDPSWLNGPAGNGDREFVMPMPDGTSWTYTPGQLTDLQALGYQYDDLAPGVAPARPGERLERLGLPQPQPVPALAGADSTQEEPPVPADTNVELVGATGQSVSVSGTDVHSHVQLDSNMRRKVTTSLSPRLAGADDSEPDRVFLNLENVRGPSDATLFQVYVGVPVGEDPADHPELLAGTIAPFGMVKASDPDDEHAGQGLTFVLEITDIVDELHLSNSFDVDALPVRIVPVNPVPDEQAITIGRISIFRQGR
jgi:tyrosinase